MDRAHSPETPIDRAYLAQEARPDEDALRLRLYERILDAELFLLLETEPEGETLAPRIFDIDEGRFVLAFDRDDRFAAFVDAPAPYAALPGRRLVVMLKGQGMGIGLNLGATPSATLLPSGVIDWLAAQGAGAPALAEIRAEAIGPPGDASETLIAALDPKLAAMAARIDAAALIALRFAEGGRGLVLALFGVAEPARAPIAAAIAEAVRFSEPEPAALDVTFLDAGDPRRARIEALGLVFELPRATPDTPMPEIPGGDPDRPPILR